MKLLLIRHTKVDVPDGICYGQSDVGVAPSFTSEMLDVKKQLQKFTVDTVFSSPLFRCKTLAEKLEIKPEICFDSRLMELNFGDFELKSWNEIYATEEGKKWMNNYTVLRPKNGESYPEMVMRINEFYRWLIMQNYRTVVIFTHAGVIRIFKSIIENKSIDKLFETFKPTYGSISVFEIEK